ncbi:helix-turn-helix transcriptional regulator [Lachnospiraceae bacterium OttesenSCG-928-D06]|nr:helix-turn-helix transcriptional regulator [Lachnospiraceae bacterium OttesenSCG-928-D06]
MKFLIRGQYHNRLFLLLLLVSVVPLMLVGSVAYNIYTDEMTKQNDLSMDAIRIQLSNDVEGVLSNMRQYYMESAEREEMKWLMETGSIPYQEYTYLYDAQKLLSGPTYLNGYVENYAFINMKLGWVLTNKGMYPFRDIRNQEETEHFLQIVRENPSTLYWYNNLPGEDTVSDGLYRSNTLELHGMWMLLKLPGTSANMDHLLMVQLNMTTLSQQLNRSIAGYEVCIMNRDGKLLFSSDDQLTDYYKEDYESISGKRQIQNIITENKQEYRVLVNDTSSNGMVYIVAYNLENVQEGAERILFFTSMLMFVFLLVIIVCWIFTNILYRPLKNLTNYVSEAGGNYKSKKVDEFSFITENVEHLIHSKAQLQGMVNEQRKMLLEQFLVRSIRGELTPEAITNAQESFSLNEEKLYRLMTVVCTLENETDQRSELEREAFVLTIMNHLPEDITAKYLVVEPFSYNEQIMLLIGGETREALSEKSMLLHNQIMDFVEEHYGCSIISGVSQTFARLKYLRTANNECSEALRNTREMSREHSDITFFEDISISDSIGAYDFVAENSLTKAIDSGDKEEAFLIVDRFVNSMHNRGIIGHTRSFYIYRLVTAILSVTSDVGLSMNQIFEEQAEDIFQNLNYIVEEEPLKVYLNQKIIEPAIEALKKYRYNESSDILRKIMEIVKDTKGNITLSECAEKLSYHPSYIWKVLKSEQNRTFTDIVTMEKLEVAKGMLLTTNMPIAEIAEQLNYSNTQNFIRFFNKYENVTPGNYRKKNK